MGSRLCRIVSVEADILAGDQHMQGMVQVIVPLRGEGHGPFGITCQISGLVAVIFEDEMYFAVGDAVAHGLREFRQDVGVAVVTDRVDRVETQPVKGEFFEPIKRIVNHEIAHRALRGAK